MSRFGGAFFQRLTAIPKRHPLAFGVTLTAFKTGTVDYLVQKYVEKAEEIDWRRNMVFVAFGSTYLGAWQYLLFVKLMPRLVPDRAGLRGLLIQNVVENGINNPLLYFPIFYTLKEYIEGGPLEDGIKKYKKHWKEDLLAIWSVWVPAQMINFAFSPMWFRVPYVACVSAGWTAFVSLTRGAKEQLSIHEETATVADFP